jgi:hypothetical protein
MKRPLRSRLVSLAERLVYPPSGLRARPLPQFQDALPQSVVEVLPNDGDGTGLAFANRRGTLNKESYWT